MMDTPSIFNGKYEYKTFSGSLWVKIFYHNASGGNNFADSQEALLCDSMDKYSILSEIRPEHRINGKYEFILYYPSLDPNYNQWRQTHPPHKDVEIQAQLQAIGYEPIKISWISNSWGGLVKSTSRSDESFICGSVGINYWYYAIGKYNISTWEDISIPGPSGAVKEVYLWMRIHDFGEIFQCSAIIGDSLFQIYGVINYMLYNILINTFL